MADEPTEKPLVEVLPTREGDYSAIASANAPFIYCDGAAVFGHYAGVIHVTLDAVRRMPVADNNSPASDRVITAHLRMSIPAAMSLKNALDGALLMALPTKEGPAN